MSPLTVFKQGLNLQRLAQGGGALPRMRPGALVALRALARVEAIYYQWDAPFVYPPILRFDVQFRVNGTPAWGATINRGLERFYLAGGLTEGTAYDLRGRAVNAEGVGPWTELLNVQPLADSVMAWPTGDPMQWGTQENMEWPA